MPPLPLLLLLVAARAIAGWVFQPASRAAMPALVGEVSGWLVTVMRPPLHGSEGHFETRYTLVG